jgi:flagellar assembly factor FliW
MANMIMQGTILGFEGYRNYTLKNDFDESSPFSILECRDSDLYFVVVDPFFLNKDYSFQVDDATIDELQLTENPYEEVLVLCIVKVGNESHSVNFRAPLICNSVKGIFKQIALQDETYPTSTTFSFKTDTESA